MKKWIGLLVLVLGLALAAAPEKKDVTIAVGGKSLVVYLPLTVAEQLGDQYGFAATRVLEVDDVYDGEAYAERGSIQEYEDEMYGPFKEQCYPPRMSDTPSRLRWGARPIGIDNEYVFNKVLGLSLEEIAKLYGSEPPKGGLFGNFFGRRGKGK